ncbi:MAG: DUF4339 domain-containing protein [Verrucomicrobiae bacterium]|nr:DUF4339 domain-containing protein [Verrucomicrobiae bacterium]
MADALYYYLDQADQPVGPLSFQQMKKMFSNQMITRETLVCRAGMNQWVPARDMAELGVELPSKFYTLKQTGVIQVRELEPKKVQGKVVLFDDYHQMPDGNRKKMLVMGVDKLPQTPEMATEIYLQAQEKRIADLEKQLENEKKKLIQARQLLEDLRQGREPPAVKTEGGAG